MNRKKIKRTLITTGTACVVAGVGVLYVRNKQLQIIDEARKAGVADWIIDMNSKDLIVLALPKEFADRVWDIFGEVPGMVAKNPDYAFAAFDKP